MIDFEYGERAQSVLIKKLAHGRVSRTIDNAVQLTLKIYDTELKMDMSKTDRLAEFRRVALQATAEKGAHQYGTTAIPTGCYIVTMSPSSKFKALRPFLTKVPGFAGIMIHEGNTVKDTRGCILVGENTKPGMVLNSRYYVRLICDAIQKAEQKQEPIMITIK